MTRRRPDSGYTNLFMHELLGALPAGARVLDLGCGRGSFQYAGYPTLHITAVDIREPDEAQSWPPHVRFQAAAAEALPFPDETFDLVVANFVFEHTQDFAQAIAEAERVLVKGGSLFLSVPNSRSFEDELYRALFAGGGHLQRMGLRAVLRTVYACTGLKLVAFADWPAGFTFFEGRDGLRQFTLALVGALRRAGYPNHGTVKLHPLRDGLGHGGRGRCLRGRRDGPRHPTRGRLGSRRIWRFHADPGGGDRLVPGDLRCAALALGGFPGDFR
ncbi:MAG: class I SAM-dependent methyltransferase [Armatimonadota bacterium]|nr:class I SAM-dependent methyltransferase [Armatimonadota bacterium]MDR7518858.1 class I SAM-dependent methyltransferase [Armatimonadota bacterium]MDR7549087.1 class I SAM-dependent methyltransferase [Armatimonadota bacterium]